MQHVMMAEVQLSLNANFMNLKMFMKFTLYTYMHNIEIKELRMEGNKIHSHHYTVQYHYVLLCCRRKCD